MSEFDSPLLQANEVGLSKEISINPEQKSIPRLSVFITILVIISG